MTNNATAGAAETSAMKDNLNAMLGDEPVAEPIEEEISESEDKSDIEIKEKKSFVEKDESNKDNEPEKKVLVPHAAFHEERERRKELQKKLAEQEERSKTLEERQNKILEALAAKNTPIQEQEYVDPLVALEREVTDLKGTIKKSAEQIETENKARLSEHALVSKYQSSVNAYIKDAPEFMDARNYLIEDKVKELKALDYSESEIFNEIKAIEAQIVQRAYQQEKNPAEVIHKLAKEKGYKQTSSEKKIEDIDKGLKASKSLGTGGSSANEGELQSLSASDLRDMSDDEFNTFFSKLEKQSKRR